MIIQVGTEVDETIILWKHNENDDWHWAEVDELIEAYEREKFPYSPNCDF